MTPDLAPDRAVYAMSVASDLTGVHPQMLRAYEARGLLAPYRTEGGTRRYSAVDLQRVQRITELLASGLNLEGVHQVLGLEAERESLRAEIEQLRAAP